MSKKTVGLTIGLGVAFIAGLCGTAAQAAPIVCNNTIVLGGNGDGFVNDSQLTAGTCVQTANAIFGNFAISDLPSGGRVGFNVTNFGDPLQAYLGISFNDNYEAGNIYTANYSVEITSGKALFTALNGDFTQNNGTSTLVTTTTQAHQGQIDWTKVGALGSGPDLITFSPGYVRLNISNTLTDGGSVTSIANDAIENKPVNVAEPASIALLGTGVLCMMAFGRRMRTIRAS